MRKPLPPLLRQTNTVWLLLAVCIFGYSVVFLTLGPRYGRSFLVFSVIPIIVASGLFGLRVGLLVNTASVVVTLVLAALDGGDVMRAEVLTNWPLFVITAIIGAIVGHFHDLQRARDAELNERQRVEQRLHNLNQIIQAIARGGQPEEIGMGVVQQLCELLDCDCITLVVNDGDDPATVRVLAAYNRTHGRFDQMANPPVSPGQTFTLADGGLSADCPLHSDNPSGSCAAHCGLTLRSYLSEPLMARSRQVGVLSLGAEAPDKFVDDQTHVVREVAAQLAIAIDNAQLLDQQQRYVAELEALRVATLQITSRLTLEHVLGAILQNALKLMHTENAHIFLYDGEQLSFGAAVWDGALQSKPLAPPRSDGLTMTVIQTRKRVVVPDASRHPLYEGYSFGGAIVGAPLLMSGRVVGVMSLAFTNPRPFSTHELRVLDLFADHAAIAVYNAQLVDRIQRQNEVLEERVNERTAELVDAHQSIEAILDNSSDAIILLDADTGTVARLNATARDWFGTDVNALSSWRKFVTPESQADIRDAYMNVVSTGEPVRRELVMQRGSGEQVYVDVALTLDGPAGEAQHVVCSLRDITGRKAAEQTRARLVVGLRAVVNGAYELLDCQTLDDLYLQAITTARTGLGLERCALYVPGDDRFYGTYGTDREGNIVPEHGNSFSTSDALWVTRLNMLRKNDAQWITVTQPLIEWRDGSVQDIGVENWVAVTPLRTPNGLVGIFFNDAGLTGKPQDPTVQELVFLYASLLAHILTRKQLEVDLRQSLHKERELNELKSRFVSMVSHEFRTPLTVIQSSGDMLKYYIDRLTEDVRKEKLDLIQEQIRHLTGLLDDILAISRAESVGLEMSRVPLDLTTLCQAVVGEFEGTTRHRTIRLRIDGVPRRVVLDARLIRQALSNLVANALKYSPEQCPVDVELFFAHDHVVLAVKDEGIGIPEGDRERIFQIFHRGGNVEQVAGTGLGLAIVKHIVDLHEGTITCESVEGHGATFRIRLPALAS